MDAPKMLYHIYEKENDREVLSADNACLLRNFISGRSNHFIVRDAYGQQKKEVSYDYELNTNLRDDLQLGELEKKLLLDTYWSSEMIEEKIIGKLHDITLRGKGEEEQCIFLLPAKDGYGFYI